MNRKRLAAIAAALVAVALVVGLLVRQARKTAKGNTENAPAAVEDRRTLEPVTLLPPTSAGDDVIGKRLAAFVVALDKASRAASASSVPADLRAAERGLRGDDAVAAALGDAAAAALGEAVGVAKAVSMARVDDETSVAALDLAVARLDNELLAARLPYFVDASVIVTRDRSRRIVLLYGFAITSTSLYASGADRVRAVRLRRLDHLNWSHTVLGFVNLLRAQAVVLLDPIEEQLAKYVLPALAPGAPMAFGGDESKPPSASAVAIGAKAGEIARAELGGLPGVEADVARQVGEALRERRGLYEQWNRGSTTELGLGVKPPKGLALDLDAFAQRTEGLVEKRDLETLEAIQARLEQPDAGRTYGALRDAFGDSVERHESQHRLDAMTHLKMSKAVRDVVHGDSAAVATIRNGVNNELSAYLAQIARDPKMPRTTYSLLVRFVVNPRTRVSSEGIAGVILTEALARELNVADVTPLVVNRRLDEERLVRAHGAITDAKAEDVALAARRAWASLFGRELLPLDALRTEPERVQVRDGAGDE